MNVREAAQKWGMNEEKIREYCREGFVEGACKNPPSQLWEIPDNAEEPFHFTPRQIVEQSGKLVVIIQAISKRKTFPIQKLGADLNLMMDYLDELVERGWINERKRFTNEDPLLHRYVLTENGDKIVKENMTFAKIHTVLQSHAPLIIPTYNPKK